MSTSARKILIVSEPLDFHAQRISKKIEERGHEPIHFSTKEFPVETSTSIDYQDRKFPITIQTRNRLVHLNDLSAVWWRRPDTPGLNPELPEDQAKFARSEYNHLLGGIWGMLDCYWMTRPSVLKAAGWKPEQLKRAASIGLEIPKTLITTDAEKAINFAEHCNDEVIYKPFDGTFFKDPEAPDNYTYQLGIYATRVTSAILKARSHDVGNTPCIFQEYVPKRVELRVTIIGTQVFVAEIDSQSHERTQTDWRHYDVPMRLKKGHLPKDIEAKCLSFVKSYGLDFSALDLVVTPDGRYVFLENNPCGQFLFVEDLVPEFRMADALVDCLLSPPFR